MFVSYNLENFGEELKKIRKNLGFNQTDVQELVGVNVDTIRKVESGRVIPRYDTLELLSVAYKEDLLELLKNSRSNKFLMEYYDDLDYIITCYDKSATTILKEKLQENFSADIKDTIVNPLELKQFIIFVDIVDAYYANIFAPNEAAKYELMSALQLTIPKYNIKRFKRYNYSYIEFRILFLISLLIANENNCTFSNEILYYILDKISDRTYSTKYLDYLIINLHFNIAYNFHMLDNHEKVIEVADQGIEYCIEKRTNHALFSLYYRKGIAQYNLRDEGHMESIKTAFYLLKANRIPKLLEQYQKITRDKYGISIIL